MQAKLATVIICCSMVLGCQSSVAPEKCIFPHTFDGVINYKNTSLTRCELQCLRHDTCTHFNWICSDPRCDGSNDNPLEEIGTCKLYEGATSMKFMKRGGTQAWCGVRPGTWIPYIHRIYNYRCNFNQVPYLEVENTSFEECVDDCELSPQCTHMVLRSNQTQKVFGSIYGICLLFSSEKGANMEDAQLLSMVTSNITACGLITLKYPQTFTPDPAWEKTNQGKSNLTYLIASAKVLFMVTFGKLKTSPSNFDRWAFGALFLTYTTLT